MIGRLYESLDQCPNPRILKEEIKLLFGSGNTLLRVLQITVHIRCASCNMLEACVEVIIFR